MSEKRVSKWGKVLVTILLLPAAIVVPVLSLESHYAPPTQAQRQQPSQQQARIAEYKAALGREVDESEQNKVRLRCDVAQANAKALATRLEGVQKKRNTAYDSILKQLNDLLARLENQAFETSELSENINTLQKKVNSFKNNMSGYYQAVDDMATVNCKADTVAFIAALQAARKAHEAVLPQVSDIRAYITNTVKPTLEQVRKQIEDGQTVGGEQL